MARAALQAYSSSTMFDDEVRPSLLEERSQTPAVVREENCQEIAIEDKDVPHFGKMNKSISVE